MTDVDRQRTSPRVALVTGSSSGIGAEVARRLAAEGMHVVVNSRVSVEAGRALASEIAGTHVQATSATRRPRRRWSSRWWTPTAAWTCW